MAKQEKRTVGPTVAFRLVKEPGFAMECRADAMPSSIIKRLARRARSFVVKPIETELLANKGVNPIEQLQLQLRYRELLSSGKALPRPRPWCPARSS